MSNLYDEHGRKIISSAAADGFVMIDFSRLKDAWNNTSSDGPEEDWDEAIRNLPEQDEVPAIIDYRLEKRIEEVIESKDIVAEAERRIFRRDRPAFEAPPIIPFTQLLSQPDNPVKFRVDQLWPAGGNVLFAAQAKFGKSTVAMNLVRSMLDGTSFLGHFECPPIAKGEKVLLIDLEMSTDRVRSELRCQGILNTDPLHVGCLRGLAKQFDITDPETRSWWIAYCRREKITTLILDPLAPLLGYLGVDENDNNLVNRFFQQLDEFKLEAGINNLLVTHHCGHGADMRPRGASRFNDWPDALWVAKIDGDVTIPTTPRLFYARGRDVGEQLQGPGEIKRDVNNSKILTFDTNASSGISAATLVTQHINGLLFNAGGKTEKDLVKDTTMSLAPAPSESFVKALLRDMVTDGTVHICQLRTGTAGRQPNGYWLPGDCPDHP